MAPVGGVTFTDRLGIEEVLEEDDEEEVVIVALDDGLNECCNSAC